MRQEDLCGRTGSYEFVIAVSGNLASGIKVIERVRAKTSIEFSSEIVQWVLGETPLQILFRLDLEAETSLT
jgi:GGDEF domain-containing protein